MEEIKVKTLNSFYMLEHLHHTNYTIILGQIIKCWRLSSTLQPSELVKHFFISESFFLWSLLFFRFSIGIGLLSRIFIASSFSLRFTSEHCLLAKVFSNSFPLLTRILLSIIWLACLALTASYMARVLSLSFITFSNSDFSFNKHWISKKRYKSRNGRVKKEYLFGKCHCI